MPDAERFSSLVAALSSDELVSLYADTIDARSEVRDSWDGPFISELDAHLSEDSCEDLTDWIVGQGHAYWERARGADDSALENLWKECVADRKTPVGRWNAATPAIAPSFFNSYAQRFDADVFIDAVDVELNARAAR